jgi:hypothetical protein
MIKHLSRNGLRISWFPSSILMDGCMATRTQKLMRRSLNPVAGPARMVGNSIRASIRSSIIVMMGLLALANPLKAQNRRGSLTPAKWEPLESRLIYAV